MATTFHHFPLLPSELQIQILQSAAHLSLEAIQLSTRRRRFAGDLSAHQETSAILLMRVYTLLNRPCANMLGLDNLLRRRYRRDYITRLNLMATSRLARGVALKAWKEDLGKIDSDSDTDPDPDTDTDRMVLLMWMEYNYLRSMDGEDWKALVEGAGGIKNLVKSVIGDLGDV